jgi:hypothetical protein
MKIDSYVVHKGTCLFGLLDFDIKTGEELEFCTPTFSKTIRVFNIQPAGPGEWSSDCVSEAKAGKYVGLLIRDLGKLENGVPITLVKHGP